jgi:hypothetical protein
MPNGYLPNRDPDFNEWQENFLTYCNDNMAALGLSAGDLAPLNADQGDWKAKYTDHQTATAAAEAATQAKKSSRSNFTSDIRSLVRRIQARPQTTNAQRAALRINIPAPRAPIAPPSTSPLALVDISNRLQHTVNYRDSSTPDRRGRPNGVSAAEIFMTIVPAGAAVPTDPSEYQYVATDSAAPWVRTFTPADAGKTACYLLRWVNPTSETGPWSEPAGATIAA